MEKWHQRLFTFSIDALELTLKLLHLGQKISVRKLVSKWRLWIYLYLRDDAIGWPVFFCLEFDHIWCQYSLSLIAQGSQVVYNFEIQGWLSEDSGLAGSDICRSVSLDVVTVLVHHLPGVGEDFSPITNGKYCCTTVIIRLLLSVALISSNFNKNPSETVTCFQTSFTSVTTFLLESCFCVFSIIFCLSVPIQNKS